MLTILIQPFETIAVRKQPTDYSLMNVKYFNVIVE